MKKAMILGIVGTLCNLVVVWIFDFLLGMAGSGLQKDIREMATYIMYAYIGIAVINLVAAILIGKGFGAGKGLMIFSGVISFLVGIGFVGAICDFVAVASYNKAKAANEKKEVVSREEELKARLAALESQQKDE